MRTRRGARKQAAVPVAGQQAHAQPSEPADTASPSSIAGLEDEAQQAAGARSFLTGQGAQPSEVSPQQPELALQTDDTVKPAAAFDTLQQPAADPASEQVRGSSSALHYTEHASLVKTGKRKDSPAALSTGSKRQRQESQHSEQLSVHVPMSAQSHQQQVAIPADQNCKADVESAPVAEGASVVTDHHDRLQLGRPRTRCEASRDTAHEVAAGANGSLEPAANPGTSPMHAQQAALELDGEPREIADSPAAGDQIQGSPVVGSQIQDSPEAGSQMQDSPASSQMDPPEALAGAITAIAGSPAEVQQADAQEAAGAAVHVDVTPADAVQSDASQMLIDQASPSPAAPAIAPGQPATVDTESIQHINLSADELAVENAVDSVSDAASAVALPAGPAAQIAQKPQNTGTASAPQSSTGLGQNLVSAIRSFLPGSKMPEPQLAAGKKPVKVCYLAPSKLLLAEASASPFSCASFMRRHLSDDSLSHKLLRSSFVWHLDHWEPPGLA